MLYYRVLETCIILNGISDDILHDRKEYMTVMHRCSNLYFTLLKRMIIWKNVIPHWFNISIKTIQQFIHTM